MALLRRKLKLLSVAEVSELTGTPYSTLYDWKDDPTHPFPKPIKIGKGQKGIRWDADEVERFIAEKFKERDKVASILNRTIRGEKRTG
jgi:predicted DNA-binding transcriptional regulator AlpA